VHTHLVRAMYNYLIMNTCVVQVIRTNLERVICTLTYCELDPLPAALQSHVLTDGRPIALLYHSTYAAAGKQERAVTSDRSLAVSCVFRH
jgi:hypothetical protein